MARMSLQAQVEEVTQTIDRLRREKPGKMGQGEHTFRIQRLEEVLRTMNFLLKHKDEFLSLIDKKS